MTKANAKTRKPMSYERRRSLCGYGFILLWLIGFITFFIRPLVMMVIYTFAEPVNGDTSYELVFRGLQYYKRLFLEDPDFLQMLSNSFLDLLKNVPIIVSVSLLVAVILNQKFIGRVFFRGVFFIPVIVATGMVMKILNGDYLAGNMMQGNAASALMSVGSVADLLERLQIPQQLNTWLIGAANSIFDLLWKTGIQILLFIAALQTVPPSVYEASSVEGASGWDNFWKVTLPIISPMILLCVVYTIIDSFIDTGNELMGRILSYAQEMQTSYSSTMALVYFVCVLVFMGIVYKIIGRFVHYSAD